MTQTAFLRLDTLLARASKTGTVLPSIFLTLCSTARLEFAFVDAEDAVGPLTGTEISVQCGVKTSPNAEEVLLLTDCADNGGESTASRRIAAWTADTLDNDELREFLGGELSKTGTSEHGPWMEIVVNRDGVVDRFSFPITLKNAFIRPEDAAPNPRDDASWTWLKSRIAVAGDLISKAVDDTLKKITLSVAVAWGDITGKPSTFAPSAHSHATSDITGLDTALAGKAASALIGANSGIAPLDSGGKVPAANLPSYVDDVIEAANLAALPGTGETGKIYVTLDTNKTYRWSGSAYVEVSGMPALASQAEAEAGSDNTKLMTPQRTAQAIEALAAGGGGGMLDPSVAYLSAVGNDTTGDGSPSAPFATWQAAYDAGFKNFRFGVGTFAGGTITAAEDLVFGGFNTTITSLAVMGHTATLEFLGGIKVGNLISQPAAAVGIGEPGTSAGNLTVKGDLYVTGFCYLQGGAGGPSDSESASGGNGGGVGTLTLEGRIRVGIGCFAAAGAGGVDNGAGAGAEGTHGNLVLRHGPDIPTPSPTPVSFTALAAVVNNVWFAAIP